MVFHLRLDEESVGQVYLAKPLIVSPDVPVRKVFELLKAENRGCVLICQEDQLVGIFTERDALKRMAAGGSLDVPIAEAMNPSPSTIHQSATIDAAIAQMSSGGYRRLPVLDDSGKPIGLLKVGSVMHYLVQHFPTFVYNLPPDPDQRPPQREGA